jgi:hypothetical protein
LISPRTLNGFHPWPVSRRIVSSSFSPLRAANSSVRQIESGCARKTSGSSRTSSPPKSQSRIERSPRKSTPSTISDCSAGPSGLTTASTIGCAARTPGTRRTVSTVSSGTPASPEATSSCALPAILSTVRRREVRSDADESSIAM